MTARLWRASAAVVLLLGAAKPGAAQRLLEWPVRTAPGAEALVGGAAAAFWNPAAAGPEAARVEVMVVDIEGPDAVDISGMAFGASVRLDARTVVTAGYNHLGIPDIPYTDDSPMPSPLRPSLDVGGDLFTAGVARQLGGAFWAGATVRIWRETAGTFFDDAGAGVGVGMRYHSAAPFRPSLAAAVFGGRAEPRWIAGIEFGSPELEDATGWRMSMGYGATGGEGPRGVAHRVSLESRWSDLVTFSAGVDLEPDPGFIEVEPVVGATLRLGRYRLGVLREEIANGFGAAYYYRLHVTF